MKKKASDHTLPAQERLILAAKEVLKDEQTICKGRMNKSQLVSLYVMIPKKQSRGMY